jgi:hypothetical protein
MSLHFANGLKLALALLVPVITTTVFHWRALVTARRIGAAR